MSEEVEIIEEQAILGACLLDANAIPEAATLLTYADFYRPAHQVIYRAIIALYEQNNAVDATLLAGFLQQRGDLQRCGGHPYIFQLIEKAPIGGLHRQHVYAVKANAKRRALFEAGMRLQSMATSAESVEAMLQVAQSAIDNATSTASADIVQLGDKLQATLDHAEKVRSGQPVDQGLPTGFGGLDEYTNGLKPGQMVIIAARPGVGKSTLAVDIMRHTAIDRGEPTLIFSLEMSEQEVRNRILSAEATIRAKDINSGNLSDNEMGKLSETINRIRNAPVFIDDSPENTMLEIMAKTKLMVKKHGIKLVVIDYLQLLKSGTKSESRQQEVSDFSRQIKLLAKSCRIPIIAISQLNRGVEKRENSRPKASDLRESGSLEQDADIVLLSTVPIVWMWITSALARRTLSWLKTGAAKSALLRLPTKCTFRDLRRCQNGNRNSHALCTINAKHGVSAINAGAETINPGSSPPPCRGDYQTCH